jgi:hypothetical protein
VSFQAYNDVTDLARLVDALRAIFA